MTSPGGRGRVQCRPERGAARGEGGDGQAEERGDSAGQQRGHALGHEHHLRLRGQLQVLGDGAPESRLHEGRGPPHETEIAIRRGINEQK